MQQNRARIPLRRINSTLRITVPIEFVRRNEFRDGDYVLWTEEDDGCVKLKFYKIDALEELAEASAA
jgi:hypothetical protein